MPCGGPETALNSPRGAALERCRPHPRLGTRRVTAAPAPLTMHQILTDRPRTVIYRPQHLPDRTRFPWLT